MKSNFDISFDLVMDIEGDRILTDDRLDPGGETYSGISRVYWPGWKGWCLIDKWKAGKEITWSLIDVLTRSFYRENFWNRIQGDLLAEISPAIADELFDTAVNVGVTRAVEFMQTAYNVASKDDTTLVIDGVLGPKTIEAVRIYLTSQPGSPQLNTEILLNCMNGEQYIYYKNNPKHKRYRGWFTRV